MSQRKQFEGGRVCSKRAARLLQGFYVLIDYHAAPGDTTVSSGNFQNDWTMLWTAIVALPDYASRLAGRLFLDLINEPDGIGVRYNNLANPLSQNEHCSCRVIKGLCTLFCYCSASQLRRLKWRPGRCWNQMGAGAFDT